METLHEKRHQKQHKNSKNLGQPQRWIDAVTLGLCLVLALGTVLGDPQAGAQPTPTPTELTEEQVKLFAKVVLQMEPLRQAAQQQANATSDEAIRDQIRRDFLRKATMIMTEQGLSVPEYNRIALKIRSPEGRALKQQIEQEIINLQQVTPPTP